MKTIYVGSGGCGDSVIISSKLLNLVLNSHKKNDIIEYKHFESDRRKNYENTLMQYWGLVQNIVKESGKHFNFSVEFYPHGKFWEVVPRNVFNTATGLTSKFDGLCGKMPFIGRYLEAYQDFLAFVMDAGGGTRGLSLEIVEKFIQHHPSKRVVLIGSKKIITSYGYNLTGHTDIETALSIVGSCEQVIGPDGMLTYFAGLSGIKTAIFYHEFPLIEQYHMGKLNPQAFAFYCPEHNSDNKEMLEEAYAKIL